MTGSNPPVTIGRTVNYVVKTGVIRPMIVVAVWAEDKVNGIQFRDGSNDAAYDGVADVNRLNTWRTSVPYDAEGTENTWHWPVRAKPAGFPAAPAA